MAPDNTAVRVRKAIRKIMEADGYATVGEIVEYARDEAEQVIRERNAETAAQVYGQEAS